MRFLLLERNALDGLAKH